jgi:prevent-host-death family protein
MRDTYSLYEAKAKLSAIIRKVREGRPVVVTLHGEPVAEIRSISPPSGGLGPRMQQLVERGIVVRNAKPASTRRPIAKRPGALKRFLDDREG